MAQLGQQLDHFLKQQKKVWQFIKAAYIWEKRMFQLNFSKKLMTTPIFPDEVFQPFVPVAEPAANAKPAEPAANVEPAAAADSEPASPAQSQEGQSEDEPILESISPVKKKKYVSMLRKKKGRVQESEDAATPPPHKKNKVKEKMTDGKILHFYSSLSEEECVELHPLK